MYISIHHTHLGNFFSQIDYYFTSDFTSWGKPEAEALETIPFITDTHNEFYILYNKGEKETQNRDTSTQHEVDQCKIFKRVTAL